LVLADFAELHDFWVRFWRDMDCAAYDDIMPRLTPDCVWMRDRECRGHAEIRASLEARPAGLFCRHLVTNFTYDDMGACWECRYDLISFGHMPSGPHDLPPYPTAGPRMIAYTATVVRGDTRLLASSLAMDFLFDRAPAAT
jgi:hypothetical protein